LGSRYDDELWEGTGELEESPPAHLLRFVRALPRADDALDLGCGDGRLTVELPAERVTGADVSVVALSRARRRLGEGARLVELTPDAPLPFQDSSFDLVLCAETIEHVRDVQSLVSEARRVLQPGGALALTTPAHGRASGARALVSGWERALDPLSPHIRFFTRRGLRRLLEAMGFEVVSLRRERGTLLAVARR
jgi:ubiquinone/menaquinone biosynthesis C-methylase UbiE